MKSAATTCRWPGQGAWEDTGSAGHCLRNVLPTIVGIMAISIPHVLSGTYVAESVFNYPGIGLLAVSSAKYHDYNLLMLMVLITGAGHAEQPRRAGRQRSHRSAHEIFRRGRVLMDAPSNDAFTIVGAGYRTARRPAVRKKGFWERLKGKPILLRCRVFRDRPRLPFFRPDHRP